MKTYEIAVTRDGTWWMVHVPAIDALTQTRHLAEVEEMARSLIAITLEVPSDCFALDVQVTMPAAAQVHLDRAARLREQSARAQAEAAAESRAAAQALHSTGMPLREVGRVLGVSYQRAHQLVTSSR